MANKVNGSGGQPLTDEQKRYVEGFRDWLLTLSREDLKIAVANVLQPLKVAYYNRHEDQAAPDRVTGDGETH